MDEPEWAAIYAAHPEYEGRLAKKGDLVYVTGKTRGRFGAQPIAQRGSYGLVISRWNSSMGTPKISILQDNGETAATTGSCARVWGRIYSSAFGDPEPGDSIAMESAVDTLNYWYGIWLEWMNKTYIPVIVCKEKGFRGGFAQSRDGRSVLVKSLQSKEKVWLNSDKVHPHDWYELKSSKASCVSVRLPFWLAKKSGMMGV